MNQTEIEIRDAFVDVPGGQVFTRTWTSPLNQGVTPIVLLHDSLGSVELWRDFPQQLALRVKRPVIAYDRLGFGQSSQRNERPSFDFIREEADVYFPAIAKALHLQQFILFGHSVGGGMSLMIAASAGKSCQAVITEAAQAFVEDRTCHGIEVAKEGFKKPGQIDRLKKYHGDKAAWVLDAWTEVWLAPEFAQWSLESDLVRVRCPVLAIHGEYDEYGSSGFPESICRWVAGPSELQLIKDCGHVPHREKTEEILDLVSRFLTPLTQAKVS